jgi:hypothetical protein
VVRVGGDLAAVAEPVGEGWQSGTAIIDTPLPAGYAAPTPPGAIDLKFYAPVRRAEFSSTMNWPGWQSRGFWPLFQHIQRRDIAMTAPVEMEYKGMKDSDDVPEGFTMAFLYRTPELGGTGEDGSIKIVDTQPLQVVAYGYQGGTSMTQVRERLRTLELWLAQHEEWEQAGDARVLGYNGPNVSTSKQWAEVQIPVKARAGAEAKDAAAPAEAGAEAKGAEEAGAEGSGAEAPGTP